MNLSEKQRRQLAVFKAELLKKNQALNLVSGKNPERQIRFLLERAFLTGKSLSPVFDRAASPVLDIGSGNGFPGLFMGILYPENLFCLCERNRKKAEFLKYLLTQAEIKNVRALCKNAEEIKEPFSLILSQAALPTRRMLKLLKRLLAPEGEAFLWKGPDWEKDWPKNGGFAPEVFKSYKIDSLKYVLLRVKRGADSESRI